MHMKKAVIFSIILLFLPHISGSETKYLKLRTNLHPGFLRIVLEGHDSIIDKALVHQRKQSVVVNFPESDFTIQTEKMVIVFKRIDKNTVEFYPGDFRGLKVFNLKYPNRLVIDIYLKEGQKPFSRTIIPSVSQIDALPLQEEKNKFPVIRTIVIDPGHGGYENGIVKDNFREKNVVLDIARKLSVLINKGTSRSFLTRGSDRFMTQTERVKFAHNKEADIFISLHIGKHSDIVIYAPVETYNFSEIVRQHLANKGQREYIKDSENLLNAMKEAVIANFDDSMVSVRPLPYSVLSRIESAAIMIEMPSFEDAYYIEELKEEMANTIYKGIYIYEEIKAR